MSLRAPPLPPRPPRLPRCHFLPGPPGRAVREAPVAAAAAAAAARGPYSAAARPAGVHRRPQSARSPPCSCVPALLREARASQGGNIPSGALGGAGLAGLPGLQPQGEGGATPGLPNGLTLPEATGSQVWDLSTLVPALASPQPGPPPGCFPREQNGQGLETSPGSVFYRCCTRRLTCQVIHPRSTLCCTGADPG